MKIKFLGSASCFRNAELFSSGKLTEYARENGIMRANAQLLINNDMIINFPSDTYMKVLKYGFDLSAVETLLVTDSHPESIYKMDLLMRRNGFSHERTADILTVYCNETVEKQLESIHEKFDTFEYTAVTDFESFTVGQYTVTPLPATRTDEEKRMIYLVDDGKAKLLYAVGTAYLPDETLDFLSSCGHLDCVIYDCTFYDRKVSEKHHMNLEDNKRCTEALKSLGAVNEKTLLFASGFDARILTPETDTKEAQKEYGITMAYDGLEAEI